MAPVVAAAEGTEIEALPATAEPPEAEAEGARVAEVAAPVTERETLPLAKEGSRVGRSGSDESSMTTLGR